MNYKKLLTTATVSFVAISTSQAAVIFQTGTSSISGTTSGLSDSHANALSGSFTTTGGGGSSGISFNLTITAINGTVAGQINGLGVSDGTTSSAIDNDFGATGDQEALTFTISGATGLGAGESLVITGFRARFAKTGGVTEFYALDGGSDIAIPDNTASIIIPSASSVSIGAGSGASTSFALDQLTIAVVPEPSSTALLGLGGLALILRRRK